MKDWDSGFLRHGWLQSEGVGLTLYPVGLHDDGVGLRSVCVWWEVQVLQVHW